MSLTITDLEKCFNVALTCDYAYVAVVVRMEGFSDNEVIINSHENISSKLSYYKSTYDENLNHKFSKGISIVSFTYGDTFEDIRINLEIE